MEELNHLKEIIDWNIVAGNKAGDENKAPVYINLIEEEYNEWQQALKDGNDVEELDALVDMIWVIVGRAHTKGYNLFGAMDEVHNSNFSKFIVDPDAVHEAVEYLAREENVIVTPRYVGGLVVLIDKKGKIRKPPTYTKADVSPYV